MASASPGIAALCRPLAVVAASEPCRQPLERLAAEESDVLLVRDEHGRARGWLRLRDVTLDAILEGPGTLDRPVAEIGLATLVVVPASFSAGECARVFRETWVRQVLVTGPSGEELGMLQVEDLLAAAAKDMGGAAGPLLAAFGRARAKRSGACRQEGSSV